MTTPLLPDTATVATFGGNDHFDEDAVVNPEAEQAAADWDRTVTQVTQVGYTADRAWVYCIISGGVITLTAHGAVWGDSGAVAPAVVRTSAGLYTITWASAYNDLQAVPESHAVSVRCITGIVGHNGATAAIVNAEIISPTVVWVRSYDAAGAAADVRAFSFGWK